MESLNIPGKANFKSLGNSAKKAVLELVRSELVTSVVPALIPTLFPINAIYSIMDPNFNPNVAWAASGTKWERLPDNHVLWTSSNPTAGDVNANKIAAGLPNITGHTTGLLTDPSSNAAYDGAFYEHGTPRKRGWTGSDADEIREIGFDASRGATTKGIYGNSTTVQPPAIKYCAWRRVS